MEQHKKVPDKGTKEWNEYNNNINKEYRNRQKEKEKAKMKIQKELGIGLVDDFDSMWDLVYKEVVLTWEVVNDPYEIINHYQSVDNQSVIDIEGIG